MRIKCHIPAGSKLGWLRSLCRYGGKQRFLPIPGTEPTLSNHDTCRYTKGCRGWRE